MGDVVNLRLVRKRRARETAETVAQGNRVKFGRTKAERAAEIAERCRAAHLLDGARRDHEEEAVER